MKHWKFFGTLSIHSMINNFKLNKHEWEKEKKTSKLSYFSTSSTILLGSHRIYSIFSLTNDALVYFFLFFFIEFMLISFVSILYFVPHISWIAQRRQNRKRNVENGARLRRYRRMPNSRRPRRNKTKNENHLNETRH